MGEGRGKQQFGGLAQDGRLLFWRIGCVFGIVAVILTTVCYFIYSHNHKLLARADRAAGTVVELRRSGGDSTYRPVVSFRTAQGQAVTFVTSWGTNPPAYRRGDQVTVLYEAAAPEAAQIESFLSFWMGTLILAFMATVFALLSAVLMIVAKRG
jgi:type VI protein secretion system component VasK